MISRKGSNYEKMADELIKITIEAFSSAAENTFLKIAPWATNSLFISNGKTNSRRKLFSSPPTSLIKQKFVRLHKKTTSKIPSDCLKKTVGCFCINV